MSEVGGAFDETGMLRREAGSFILQRDSGGTVRLILPRVPVDHVGKRVRVTGRFAGDALVDADGIAPA
jgi:hypothetical protein